MFALPNMAFFEEYPSGWITFVADFLKKMQFCERNWRFF